MLRVTLATSAIGISLLMGLMWLLGPIGIYVGFLTQMLLRSAGLVLAAKRRWEVRISISGVAAGLLLILLANALSVYGSDVGVAIAAYLTGLTFLAIVFFPAELHLMVGRSSAHRALP